MGDRPGSGTPSLQRTACSPAPGLEPRGPISPTHPEARSVERATADAVRAMSAPSSSDPREESGARRDGGHVGDALTRVLVGLRLGAVTWLERVDFVFVSKVSLP